MERLNKVILLGNVGRDPCIRYLPTGSLEFLDAGNSEAATAANCLALHDYIANLVTFTLHEVVRRPAGRFFYLVKTRDFFGATKVNLRNAP
jgi:hypothetical protein